MDISQKILSDIIVYNKYAKYRADLGRRETWEEICERNMVMHAKKFPKLATEIAKVYQDYVIPRKVLMSMRSAQFAGRPIDLNPTRIFNCSYMPVDDYRSFSEAMFLLLGGTGVGYSVQTQHVEKLPYLRKPVKTRRYVVGDSIEGWADSVKVLMRSYFEGKPLPKFDYSDIREKGAPLITSGGKAPGPQPLHDCHHNIKKVLDSVDDGAQLTSLQCHDIMCHIADAVLAGGIRRAACISLFDIDDESMLTCKFGNWWELNPQRGRANNSCVVDRNKITKEKFLELWKKIEASGSGEPGISFSNNPDWGTNPCHEASLRPYEFCNLLEINMSDVTSQEEFNNRCKAAAFIGTLQASYTDFHYLRPIWKKTTEKDALIGVGLTGIASNTYKSLNINEGARLIKTTNEEVAEKVGVNKASRTTVVKPAGTTSLVVGSSSGIHAWHSPFYIRRVRLNKNEALARYLIVNHSELVEDEFFRPNEQIVVEIPQKAPAGAITRDNETALQLLERVKLFSSNWISEGHRKGDNQNNVSTTVSIKEDEWEEVGEWMWNNREHYTGLSVLPYDGGSYKQAPFEEITEEEYEKRMKTLREVDLTKIEETSDNTDLAGEVACGAGGCEIS